MSAKTYGWRGRLGLLVPDLNTVTEVEFNKYKPEGVTVYAARLPVQDPVNAESMERMNEDIPRAANTLAKTDPDVLVYAVTAGSFVGGKGYDTQLENEITELTQVPAVATAAAVRRALQKLDINSLVIATPYVTGLNDLLVEFLEDHGYSVLDLHGEEFDAGAAYGTSTPELVYQRVKNLDTAEADGVFISGMEYHGFPRLEHLESDLGKPVVSAHQATLWNALRVAGVSYDDIDGGRLFADH